MSNRRSIITTGSKLFRISMLSTEPALSTVAVKPKITAFKTPSNNGKCYDWYCILRCYTWLSTVCPANTCKDIMRLYEYACCSESSLDLLVILLVLLCTGSFSVVVHDALSAVCGAQVLPRVDNA